MLSTSIQFIRTSSMLLTIHRTHFMSVRLLNTFENKRINTSSSNAKCLITLYLYFIFHSNAVLPALSLSLSTCACMCLWFTFCLVANGLFVISFQQRWIVVIEAMRAVGQPFCDVCRFTPSRRKFPKKQRKTLI